MRIEVHVHGSLFLCKGVSQVQVEAGLRKWLDYLDVENIGEIHSLEQSEPGVVFDRANRVLDICWTGEIGRSFRNSLQQALFDVGPLLEHASEIELTFYHEDGRDEYQLIFAGPNAESIHQAQRRRMLEDVTGLLSRHFGQAEVDQVSALVNNLFDADWEKQARELQSQPDYQASGKLVSIRRKHLH